MRDIPVPHRDIFNFPEEGAYENSTAMNYLAASSSELDSIAEEPAREASDKSIRSGDLLPRLEALSLLVDGYTSYRDNLKKAGDIVFSTSSENDGCIAAQTAASTDIMLLENIERQLNLIVMAKIEGEMGMIRDRAVEQGDKADGKDGLQGKLEKEREVLMELMRVVDEPL